MARRRFFVPNIDSGCATLSGDDARHLTRVLRAEPGQRYEISDHQGLYLAEITATGKDRVDFMVVETLPEPPSGPPSTLWLSLIKFDRFEWAVEKATELGVSEIVPVEAERSEKGLLEAARKRVERWRRIAFEAGQQSRRIRLPRIADPRKLAPALGETQGLVLEEEPGAPPLSARLNQPITLLVGPEGGWTDHERELFQSTRWTPVSLGPQILRAETAAIAALSIAAHLKWEQA